MWGKIKDAFIGMQRKFTKQETPELPIDYEAVKTEFWEVNFDNSDDIRFTPEKGDGYELSIPTTGTQGLDFLLQRKNLYAWSINQQFRYHNFVIEAEIDFSDYARIQTSEDTTRSGDFAGGFLLRYISEGAFYAVLISNAGWIRIDAVVNSTPMPVLGWIKPVNHEFTGCMKIMVVMTGTRITLAVNNNWVAVCSDDTVQAPGKIGIAGQNWQTYRHPSFTVRSFSINSLPFVVETLDSTLNAAENIVPEARINLAKTLIAMGFYVPALFQLKAIWENRSPTVEEHLLAGQIYFARRLTDEAESEFIKARNLDPKAARPIIELLNLYYYANNFQKMQQLFLKLDPSIRDASPIILNLYGHFLHTEKKYTEAAEAYLKASEQDPEQGLFLFNAANEYISAELKDRAIETYLQAGQKFLSVKNYTDLSNVVDILERIASKKTESHILFAKFYYAIENYPEAMEYLRPLCKNKSTDASVWYLYGMLQDEEHRSEAIKAFKKARSLEPDYGLYIFRLAETLYLCGKPFKKVLKEALAADPENGWIHNLAALAALDANDMEAAQTAITTARTLLPADPIILENYFEVQRCRGNIESCVRLCTITPDDEIDPAVEANLGTAYHALANTLFADKKYDTAKEWFDKALTENPKNIDLMVDYAENAIELGLFQDADDFLGRAFEVAPSLRIYELIAILARKMGDLARAELTLRHACDEFGDSANILYGLCLLYIDIKKYSKAEHILQRLLKLENSPRVDALKKRIGEA